jgi:predicted DNA-binding antitoxin AbrB/MazE fold protein
MTRVTEAVYSQGVLKPAEDLGLQEDPRVRLIVETVEDNPEDRARALARLKAGIATMQLFSQGRLPSREELHDRLDTNVLIYACDKADPACQDRAESDFEHHSGVRLWQVACEFIAASRKLERQGFTARDAWARLADFLELFQLVIPAGNRVLDRAKHLHLSRNIAFGTR